MRYVVSSCRHRHWRPVATPSDSTSHFYRCRCCGVFGFKKSKYCRPYRCGVAGCFGHAVDRLAGRTSRVGMKWRCGKHMGQALAQAPARAVA